MAVTRIWTVTDSLTRVVSYIENPEKTTNPQAALCDALDYAADGEKTERGCYVTGVNCFAESAYEQMCLTKRRYGKTDKVLAYHAYQSFPPDEVTPEECHRIGVELAKRIWGDRFEVLVATHLNTNCCHNHFVVNSVSFKDGKKFEGNHHSYYTLRDASDAICRENGLSVLTDPQYTKTPRNIYLDEKAGKPTRYNVAREDIRAALSISGFGKQFGQVMRSMGYEFSVSKTGHTLIKAQGWKHPIPMDSLGEEFTQENIRLALMQNTHFRPYQPPIKFNYSSARLRGKFSEIKGIKGLRAQYVHLCYRMGIFHSYKPLSPEMRQEVRKMDRYMERLRLLTVHRISTVKELLSYREQCREQIELLCKARSRVDNRRRRCDDPQKKEEYSRQRSEFTVQIKALRKDVALTEEIETNMERVSELIRIEVEQAAKFHPKNKNRQKQKGAR